MHRCRYLAAVILVFFVLGAWPASAEGENDGRTAFNVHCRNCHSMKKGDNRLGPSLYGIFGAKSGQVDGYNGYSGGLTGIRWDEATLDQFIADPTSISSSTNMIYPPVAEAAERRRIIEFLKSISTP